MRTEAVFNHQRLTWSIASVPEQLSGSFVQDWMMLERREDVGRARAVSFRS